MCYCDFLIAEVRAISFLSAWGKSLGVDKNPDDQISVFFSTLPQSWFVGYFPTWQSFGKLYYFRKHSVYRARLRCPRGPRPLAAVGSPRKANFQTKFCRRCHNYELGEKKDKMSSDCGEEN